MIKTIKFESLNMRQFNVVGIVYIDENDNSDFEFEFINKGFCGTEKKFTLSPDEVTSLTKYKRRCLADIGR